MCLVSPRVVLWFVVLLLGVTASPCGTLLGRCSLVTFVVDRVV